MGLLRASILGMMAVVVAFAVAFAALRTASELWFGVLYTFTTVLLLVAVISARFLRGGEKAFWFGFAVFGWGFFILEMGPWTVPFVGQAFGFESDIDDGAMGGLNRHLLTSRLVYFLVPHLGKQTDDMEAIDKITATTIATAHLLMTLALAICGGIVATLMRRGSRRAPSTGAVRSRGSHTIVASLIILALLVAASSPNYFSRTSSPFFPNSVFGERKDVSEFVVGWYSKHLNAMNEPSLWLLSQRNREVTTYRLLWLPSFDHPVCVRISRIAEGMELRAIVLDGKGGCEPGQVAIDKTIILGDDQWRRLEQNLKESVFWSMPTKLEDDGGNDGDQLIMEGVEGGRYHIVDRWEPDPAYAELCHFMLNLTGLKVQDAWERYHSKK